MSNRAKMADKHILTTPDLVVLSLLSEMPMHGYDINAELKRRDVEDWAPVSRPQVYYSLKKLYSSNLISEASDKFPVEGPERQIYRITKKGKKALSDNLNNPNWATQRPLSAFLTWLALSTHTDKDTISRIISERKKFLTFQLNKEKDTLKSFEHEADNPMLTPAILMVELTIKQFELELNWLKNVESKLLDH